MSHFFAIQLFLRLVTMLLLISIQNFWNKLPRELYIHDSIDVVKDNAKKQ